MGIDIDRFPTLSPSPSSLIAGGTNEDDVDDDDEDEDDRENVEKHKRGGSNSTDAGCTTTAALSTAKMAVLADGEMVVFDDISDNWQSNFDLLFLSFSAHYSI